MTGRQGQETRSGEGSGDAMGSGRNHTVNGTITIRARESSREAFEKLAWPFSLPWRRQLCHWGRSDCVRLRTAVQWRVRNFA